MNVETEEWTLGTQVQSTAEPSKIKLIFYSSFGHNAILILCSTLHDD